MRSPGSRNVLNKSRSAHSLVAHALRWLSIGLGEIIPAHPPEKSWQVGAKSAVSTLPANGRPSAHLDDDLARCASLGDIGERPGSVVEGIDG